MNHPNRNFCLLLHSTFIIIIVSLILYSQRIDYLAINPHFYTSEFMLGCWAFRRQIELSSILSIFSYRTKIWSLMFRVFESGLILDVIKIIEIYGWLWCFTIFHTYRRHTQHMLGRMVRYWFSELFVCYALRLPNICLCMCCFEHYVAQIMNADSVRFYFWRLIENFMTIQFIYDFSTFTIE